MHFHIQYGHINQLDFLFTKKKHYHVRYAPAPQPKLYTAQPPCVLSRPLEKGTHQVF